MHVWQGVHWFMCRLMKLDFYGQRELNSSLAGQLPKEFLRLNMPMNSDVSAHDVLDLVVVSQFTSAGDSTAEATISCVGLYEATSGHILGSVDYIDTLRPQSGQPSGWLAADADCGRCCVKAAPPQLFVPYRALLPEGASCTEHVDGGICAKATQLLLVLGKRGSTVMLNWQMVTASGSAIIRTGGVPKVELGKSSLMNLGSTNLEEWNSTVASWMLLARAGNERTAPFIVSYPVTAGYQHPGLLGTVLDTVSAEVVALDPSTFAEKWRLATVQPRVLSVLGNAVLSGQGALHVPVLINATTQKQHNTTKLEVRVLKLRSGDGHLLWQSAPLASFFLTNGTLTSTDGKTRSIPAFVAALHPSALLVCQQGRFGGRPDSEVDVGVAALGHSSGAMQWALPSFIARLQYDPSAPNGISVLNNAPSDEGYFIPLPVRCGGAMIVDDVRLYAPLVSQLPLNLTHPGASKTTLALGILSQTVAAPSSAPWVHFVSSLNRSVAGTGRIGEGVGAHENAATPMLPPLLMEPSLGSAGAQLVPQFLDLIISSSGRIALELNLASPISGVQHVDRLAFTKEKGADDDMQDDDLPEQRQNAGVEVTAIGCAPSDAGFWNFLTGRQLLLLAVCLFAMRIVAQGTWTCTVPLSPKSAEEGESHLVGDSQQEFYASHVSHAAAKPWWATLERSSGASKPAGQAGAAPTEDKVEEFLLGTIACCSCPTIEAHKFPGRKRHVLVSTPSDRPVSQLGPLTASAAASPLDNHESSGDDSSEDTPLVPGEGTADWRAVASQVLDEQFSGWQAASTVCVQTVCPCLGTVRSQRQAYRSSAMSAIAQAQSSGSPTRSMKQMMQDIACGCNSQCCNTWCGCKRVQPVGEHPHSGCRWGRLACTASPGQGAGVPWLLLTFVNVAIASALVMWSASDALTSINELVTKIEQPTAFYRQYIIDREPTESFGCPSPTLAACYCEGSVDGTVAPIWDGDRLEDNTACQAPPDASSLQSCTLACTATLRNTGNCASSVFHYSCGCGTAANGFQDTSLNINASLSSASMRTPGLVVGLSNCRAHYLAVGSSIIACTAAFVVTGILAVVGSIWMRVSCCSPRSRKDASASVYGICRQRRSLMSWFHYIAALYVISIVLFVFWQVLLTQNGRVCSGADGDSAGTVAPRTSEDVQPDDSYILQHITGCALGAGWHNSDLEGLILRKVQQAWFFNLVAFCALAVDSALGAAFAACYWRNKRKQDNSDITFTICCVGLQNLFTA